MILIVTTNYFTAILSALFNFKMVS